MPAKRKQQPVKKLKQVHWIKVNERKVKDTIWESMKDEEVKIDKDELENLFAAKTLAKEATTDEAQEGDDAALGQPGGLRKKRVVILLSANRSQTIGVLLSHLKIPHEEFRRAIMALDTRTLQPNFVVQLMRLLPTDQEVAALQSYTGPKEELGTAERFLFELLCIPRLKPRLQCFVFILEFNARLHDLSENVEVLNYALHDIKRCSKLVKVFELILAIGNYLNGTGPRGGAYGFKLEVLTKLADTKTNDNKSTLLHYLVSFIEREYKSLLDFPQELSNVEIGAKVSENVVEEISKFKKEIKFIYEEMNRPYYKSNAKNDPCGAKLEQFYHTAYNDMEVLEQNKKDALSLYKEVSKTFGEEDLKPDEFLTQIHQFAQAFKEAYNENVRKKEEEERIRSRREAFIKQMAERDRQVEARKKGKAAPHKPPNDPRLQHPQNKSKENTAAKPEQRQEQAPLKQPPSSFNSRAAPKSVQGDSDDSITQMINTMPKSGKFVIKKQATKEGSNLLRDHLQQKKDEQPSQSTSSTPLSAIAPSNGTSSFSDSSTNSLEGPEQATSGNRIRSNLKDLGRFLTPGGKRK